MIDLSLIHTSLFYEITALLTLTVVLGFIGLLLRQPMLVTWLS